MKLCPSELAADFFYDMIVNRSKVIEAIIKDLYENFLNYTRLPNHDFGVLNLSFKTNEISKDIGELTSAFKFDRSVHIDGYKTIEILDDQLEYQCNL